MISVIIPLYNKEPIIERSLQSVLSQDYDDFEVVVVNDGSTDRSADIVRSINDPRIRLIEQENGGPSKARNTGVNNAKGDWILFLDADDELLPGALVVFCDIIAENQNVDIVDCNSLYFDYKTNENKVGYHPFEGYVKNPFKMFFYSKIGPGSNHSCFRRDILLEFPYNEQIRRFEDGELLMRLLDVAKIYSSTKTVAVVHTEYSCASMPRKNVMDDYFAYLDFNNGSFWKRMCVYKMFLENRELYPEYGKKHYAKMYKRYDWLLMYKLLNWFGKFFK